MPPARWDTTCINIGWRRNEQRDLSKEKPDVIRTVKSRFAPWEKQMAEAEPREPFRDF